MTTFHVITRSKEHQSFNFHKGAVSVGRSPENDIKVDDISVSRKHFVIHATHNKYYIRDLKSTNGTFVNNKQIDPDDEYEIGEGVPIALGKTIISIGKAFEGDVSEIFDAIDFSKDASSTARIQEETRPMTSKNNMDFICRLSRILVEPLDINSILEKGLDLILDLLKRIDRGQIFLINCETGRTEDVIARHRKEGGDATMMFSPSVMDHVLGEGNPVMIINTSDSEEEDLSRSLRSLGIGSMMCVPLIIRSKIWGVIYLDSIQEPHGFREEDLMLITAMSVPIALAIENAWLYSRHRKQG
jgi:hypothetical protein